MAQIRLVMEFENNENLNLTGSSVASSNASMTVPATPGTPTLGNYLEMPNLPSPIKLDFGSPMAGLDDPNISFTVRNTPFISHPSFVRWPQKHLKNFKFFVHHPSPYPLSTLSPRSLHPLSTFSTFFSPPSPSHPPHLTPPNFDGNSHGWKNKEGETKRLRERHQTLQTVLKNMQEQVIAYKKGTAKMRKAAKALGTDNARLRAKYAEKKKDLKRALTNLKIRESELAVVEARVDELEAILAERADGDETETETDCGSEVDADASADLSGIGGMATGEALASALEEKAALEAEVEAMRQVAEELEKVTQQLEAETQVRQGLESALAEEQRKVFSLSKNSCLLASQLEDAKAHVATQAQLLEDIRSREAEAGEGGSEAQVLAIAELTSRVEEAEGKAAAMEGEAEALRAQLEGAHAALREMEGEVADLQIQASLPNQDQAEHIAALEDMMGRANAELDATHDALGAAETKALRLEDELEIVLTKIQDMHHEHASMEREYAFSAEEHGMAVSSAASSAFVKGAVIASAVTSALAGALAYFFISRRHTPRPKI